MEVIHVLVNVKLCGVHDYGNEGVVKTEDDVT